VSGRVAEVPTMMTLRKIATAIVLSFAAAIALHAQDTRTVTQPVIPASCTVLTSQTAIVSGEPASETAFDTARIQAALNSCPSGEAVELAPSGSNYAFLMQPITIPSGVTLLVDGGVTVFASRNPADYQAGTPSSSVDTCGTVGTHGNGCTQLIGFASGATGSGIMGYGVIDGRGEDKLLVNGVASNQSWWDVAASYGTGQSQNNFITMYTSKASNLTIYGVTFKNSPMFHLKWNGPNGYTVWDTKIITPWTARNTDGLDISGTNVTVAYSSVSDGDDEFAMGSSSAQAGNMTIQYNNTYSGHGVSVGSYTNGGLQNVLVDHVNMAGMAADSNENALRIKSAVDRGGVVQNFTYQNMCIQNTAANIQLTPFYNTNSGTKIPLFQNIYFHNINFLTEGSVGIQGYDSSHLTTVQFDGVTFQNLQSKDITTTSYATIALGPGVVYPSALQTLSGTGVTVTGTAAATNTPWSACGAGTFPYVVGDLFLGGSANNRQTATIGLGSTLALAAVVEPAVPQISYAGSAAAAALTNPVNFLEGGTVVGTGTLGANGTLATVSIKPTTTGTHTYTAQYPADANYATLNFGSVAVNVVLVGTTPSAAAVTVTPSSLTFGTSAAITATITGVAGTAPTGSVQFYDGSAVLGSSVALSAANAPAGTNAATLNSILSGGVHNITAVYTGDATYANSSSSVTQATVATATTATALKISVASGAYGTSPVLTATITSTASAVKPTGYVTIMDGSTTVGQATLNTSGVATYTAVLPASGAHSYTAVYSGDTNYSTSTSTSVVTFSVTTTSSTTVLSPSATNQAYGNSLTLTATVNGVASSAPTGTVIFYDGSTALNTATLNSSGVATYTITLPIAGTHVYSGVYSGDTNYNASTSSNQSVTVAKVSASPVMTLTPATALYGGVVTFSATVTAINGGGVPTGIFTFTDTSVTPNANVGQNNVSTSGTAQLTTIGLAIGSHTLIATYSGDTNYSSASSTAQTVNVVAPYTPSISPTSLTAKIGGAAVTATVSITPPAAGNTGTVTLLCVSPTKYVICTLSPASVTLSGTSAVTSTMSVSVAATTSDARPVGVRPWGAAVTALAALLMLPFARRRSLRALLCLVVMLAAVTGMIGCAGGGASSTATGSAPPTGSLTLTLSATQGTYQSLATLPLTVTN